MRDAQTDHTLTCIRIGSRMREDNGQISQDTRVFDSRIGCWEVGAACIEKRCMYLIGNGLFQP